MIKLPKYIINELNKASDYAVKSSECVRKFEEWVKINVDENFNFEMLRGEGCEVTDGTEALTEIEYDNEVDVFAIELVLNQWRESL